MPTLISSDRNALLALGVAALLALTAPAGSRPSFEVTLPRLDPNRATPLELAALPGLGPALARRIVIDRQTHGPFPTLEALTRVRGIGPGLLARLRPYLTLTPEASEGAKGPNERR